MNSRDCHLYLAVMRSFVERNHMHHTNKCQNSVMHILVGGSEFQFFESFKSKYYDKESRYENGGNYISITFFEVISNEQILQHFTPSVFDILHPDS